MMTDKVRADPLGDLSDFAAPRPLARPRPPAEEVRKVAEANGFVARTPPARVRSKPEPAPPPIARRYRPMRQRTNRNLQLNLKVDPDTLARFNALAEREGWNLGDTFVQLLDAYDAQRKENKR